MSKAKLPDGRRRNDSPHKIVVRLSDQQLPSMRAVWNWLWVPNPSAAFVAGVLVGLLAFALSGARCV
jgi:hypothetical protein